MEKILEKDPTNSRAKELQGLVRDNSSASKSTTSATAMTAAPAQAAQMSSVVNTTTTAGAISLPKQAVAQAIEKVAVPATPQVIPSPVTQASSAIDLEIGQLEEAKRHKRIADVQRVVSELLIRPHISAEQKEIVLCIKAEVEVLEGRMEEGLKVYSQVLDANPASARAIAGRGVVAAAEGRWDEARAQFERANSYRPNYDLVLAGLGLCAWQAGDTATAWERFRQALKANPENTRALLGMMQIGYPQQRYAEIAEAIEQYLELHPADLEWMYSLAGCYFALTKLDEATEIINRIKIFKPEHEKARELSSMIDAKRQGDTPSTEATAR
jgi:tetratricopeptide (TPR) repeat protein